MPCSFPSGRTLTPSNRRRALQTAVALLILETQRKAKEDEEKKAVASVEKKRTLALHEQHLEAEKVGRGSRENSAQVIRWVAGLGDRSPHVCARNPSTRHTETITCCARPRKDHGANGCQVGPVGRAIATQAFKVLVVSVKVLPC